MKRRNFIFTTAAASVAYTAASQGIAKAATVSDLAPGPIYKAIKFGMFQEDIPVLEKFRLLQEMGFDGVEFDSPADPKLIDAGVDASRETGLPIHGVVDSIHWNIRLSDPDPAVRQKGLEGLLTAIRDSKKLGGTAVLLVPGKVSSPETENQAQVWERSSEQIKKALPLAAQLGIHILIENVWNGFCYVHDGPDDQKADQLADYIDSLNSPWVGSYFDIGNHRKYAKPEEWIRRLGKRIVKVDVKGWGKANGFCKIGDGDINWLEVRKALAEIGFTGWATAEVAGGNRDRIAEIGQRMDKYVLGR